jgi:hypothetical protein
MDLAALRLDAGQDTPRDRACRISLLLESSTLNPEGATMRRILAFSVLACLAASPAFAFGSGSGGGIGAGSGGIGGAGVGTGAGTEGHGESDARGYVGNGYAGQTEGMRWDDELRCVNTARCK